MRSILSAASSYSNFSPDLTTFRGIGGKQQRQGVANFTLALGETKLTVPLHVVELGQADLILGMDLLMAHVQQLELANGLLMLTNGEEINLFHRERLDTVQVHAVKSRVVPGKTAQFLLAAPVGNPSRWSEVKQGLIEPLNHVFDRTQLIISTNLAHKNKNTLAVYVINPSEDDVSL